MRAVDVGNSARAAVAHHELEFALKDFDNAVDTGLTEGAEPPQERPSNADGFGAESERFENVGASAVSAVDKYGNPAADFGDNFRKSLERGAKRFGGAAAMIGNQNSVEAVFQPEARVLMRIDALDNECG